MNNKKLILGAVLAVLAWGTTLAYGQGNGLWQVITAEERAKLQSLSPEERMEYAQQLREKYGITQGGQQRASHSHSPEDIIANIPVSDLTDEEKQLLIDQYWEEKLAHDLYVYAYEKYGLDVFKNIADSETQHQEALQVLFDRYGLTPPSDYARYTDVADDLKSQIDESLESALNVGVQAEIDDIEAIYNDILKTDNEDVRAILTRIGGASYNHLRGFANALEQNWYDVPDVVYDYLSEDELAQKWSLVYKLAERLESEGIELPEVATSAYIKNNCANQGAQTGAKAQRWSQMATQRGFQGRSTAARGKYVNNTKVNRYRGLIKNKYQNRINQYSRDGLVNLVAKIDALETKIMESDNYSDTKKETYISVLEALKLVIQERLMELDGLQTDLIDSLFSN